MANSKRPRKKYTPKYNKGSGFDKMIRCSISGESMTEEYVGELELIALTALDSVTKGHGTRRDWDCLARCLNQSFVLANNGIGPEAKELLEDAQKAMLRTKDRFHQKGKIILDGDGLLSIRKALSIWSDQLRISKVGEVDSATRLVEKHYWSKDHELR